MYWCVYNNHYVFSKTSQYQVYNTVHIHWYSTSCLSQQICISGNYNEYINSLIRYDGGKLEGHFRFHLILRMSTYTCWYPFGTCYTVWEDVTRMWEDVTTDVRSVLQDVRIWSHLDWKTIDESRLNCFNIVFLRLFWYKRA